MNRNRWMVLLASFALVVTACGDDDDAAGDTPDTEADAGDDSPIVIGFHNVEGGAISLPEFRLGWEEGVAFVNEELGGVNGRPLEPVFCNTDGSPESSIACANQFIEEGVVAAVQGIDLGADAMLPILADAGIAEIGTVAATENARVDVGHSFFFGSPVASYNYAALLGMRDAGATTVRFFSATAAGVGSSTAEEISELGRELDMDVETIPYDPASPDWASLVATALADSPDGIGAYAAPEPDCIGMVGAVLQSGFDGPVLAGGCSAFIDVLGAEAVAGVLTFSDLYSPLVVDDAPDDIADNVQKYVDRMTSAGHADIVNGFAQFGFSTAVDLADALRQIDGDLTADTVLAGMPTVSGTRFMGGEYDCDGSMWPGQTACSLGVLLTEVLADGGRELVSDGFLDLSEYRPEG